MARTTISNVLGPGAASAIAAFGAQLAGQDATVSIAAGALGAMLGTLLFRDAHPKNQPIANVEPAPPQTIEIASAPTSEIDDEVELRAGLGRILLEHMPVGFILIGRNRQVQFINSEARSYFGRGVQGRFHISALRAPRLLEAIDRVLTGDATETMQFSMSRAETVDLCAHIRGLAGEPLSEDMAEQAGALVMIEDQTDARRAEMMHRDFVANASHELKTPLASISGIIETLLGHAKDDPVATERFLNMMGQQTDRMKRLVRDLLSLNRIEINERVQPRTPQPLGLIVAEAADGLLRVAEQANISIQVDHGDRRLVVLGDREELMQVFTNLIDNAIKYGRDGTSVDVSITYDQEARPGMVGIAIRDHGHGIAREHIPRLTERFYRVSVSRSREMGGTGLGLAIVKHIVNRHRGDLEIISNVGHGSTFVVWLPIASPERATESDGSESDSDRMDSGYGNVAKLGPPVA